MGSERSARAPWPPGAAIRVRMGLHTGTASTRGGDYFGAAVNRAARICGAGNGGQVLLSAATAALVADEGWVLTDLGEHRLKGIARPERLFRLDVEDLPVVDRRCARRLVDPATCHPSDLQWSVATASSTNCWRTSTITG